MCSDITIHDIKPFSKAFKTKLEFRNYYDGVKDKENCNTIIGVPEVACILNFTPGTLLYFNCKKKNKLPPPIKDRRPLGWHISTLHKFTQKEVAAPPAPPPAAPVPEKPKRGPGRPSKASKSNT